MCKNIKGSFLAQCGVASLAIMGLHHPLYDVLMFPLMNRMHLPMPVERIIMVGITLVITLAMYRLMSTYTPLLLGKTSSHTIK